ncbi:DedA family protein [Alteromonas sp. KUL49]|nr:DedA family protein [Alteromonas sp. KUL49]
MFVAAFGAATILPLGSEVVFVGLLTAGSEVISLWLVASIGNTLGSAVNYYLGLNYGEPLAKRMLRMSDNTYAKAESMFQRWGKWTLLLAWVPVIGDPLTLVAGALKVQLRFFLVAVLISKSSRYGLIAWRFFLPLGTIFFPIIILIRASRLI